jgi:hypothetical protein
MLPPQDHSTAADDWHGLKLIARGANRVCVRDPGDPSMCLKLELALSERTRVGPRQRLRRRLSVLVPGFGENHAELRAYRALRQRLQARTDGKLAACHGLVAMPQGLALRCECIVLDDGRPAQSLYHHLFAEPSYSAPLLCAAVDAFEAWLLENEVPLFDLNAGNFVVVPDGERVSLVCIDVKSTVSGKEIVPVSRWFKPLMRRKIRRRAQRLRQRIAAALPAAPGLAGPAPGH